MIRIAPATDYRNRPPGHADLNLKIRLARLSAQQRDLAASATATAHLLIIKKLDEALKQSKSTP